jgi:hypothetical protein
LLLEVLRNNVSQKQLDKPLQPGYSGGEIVTAETGFMILMGGIFLGLLGVVYYQIWITVVR